MPDMLKKAEKTQPLENRKLRGDRTLHIYVFSHFFTQPTALNYLLCAWHCANSSEKKHI